MALSTNIPRAKISEKSTIKFREIPRAPKIRNEMNMERGMESPTKIAFRKPRKNNRNFTASKNKAEN